MIAFLEPDSAEFFLPELPQSPYPGLRPFEKSEWPIFFGRERMTDEVIKQLLQRQLVVVHGASGDGKSSLVRAGVQARLEQQYARSGLCWRTCEMRPRGRPLANLADAFAGLFADPARLPWIDVRRALNHGRKAPESLSHLLALSETDRVCILFDQFEELFRFEREVSHEESSLLTDFLVGFQENPPPAMHVLVTMRSEFLGDCARFDGLAETINRTQYLLPRMTVDDLLRAVCEPAALYRGKVTEPLAERLIADARGGQDELPLVQLGLSLLWQFSAPAAVTDQGLVLDLPAYEDRGPLERLLSEHADSVLNAAAGDSAGQKIIEELFRALTDPTANGKAIRRPQCFRDLVAVTGTTEDRLRTILDAFRQPGVSFITPYPPEPIDAETMIDVSHEALIRRWHKIADPQEGWLQKEIKDGLMWRALLVEAESFKKNPKSLLSEVATEDRGAWLQGRNEAWARRYGGNWPAVDDLMKASRDEVERRRQQATAIRQREREDQARRTHYAEAVAAANLRTVQRTRIGLVASLLFAIAAGIFSYWARQETRAVRQSEQKAIAATLRETQQKDRAERHLKTAIEVEGKLHAQLPKLRDQGIWADQLKDILGIIVQNEETLRADADTNVQLQHALVNSLPVTAETLWRLDDRRGARERAEIAREFAKKLVTSEPHVDRWRQNLWKSHNLIGNVLLSQMKFDQSQGKFDQAKFDEMLGSYKEGLEIAKGRAEEAQEQAERQLDLLISDVYIGEALEWKSKLDNARGYLEAALKIAKEHARKDQSETSVEYDRWLNRIDRDIAIAYLLEEQTKVDDAIPYLEEALTITREHSSTDLSNLEWQESAWYTNFLISIMEPVPPGRAREVHDAEEESHRIENQLTANASVSPSSPKLLVVLAKMQVYSGYLLLTKSKFNGAINYYKKAHKIRKLLADRDPSNIGWQSDLKEIDDTIGAVAVELKKLDDALAAYRESLKISEEIADKDPSDTDWQRIVSLSAVSIGDVLRKQHKVDQALGSYKEALAIGKASAETDKTYGRRQANIDDNIAALLVENNKLDDALDSYRESLKISKGLAEKDPGDTDLEHDLSNSHLNIGDVLRKQHKVDEALGSYKEALTIGKALAETDKTNAQRQANLKWGISMIGIVAYKFELAGAFADALAAADLAISLAPPGKNWIHGNRAHALMFLGQVDEARTIYLQHRGEKIGDKAWETAIHSDFTELRNDGHKHPLMDKIEKLFAKKK
jgi:tetratricopeptide (TPR) repeat protein